MSAYAEQILGGARSSHSGPPMLNAEQLALVDDFHGHLVACAIHRTQEHGTWFSAATLQASGGMRQALARGQMLGLWREVPGKNYWKYTHMTWPFVMTSMARDAERKTTSATAQKENQHATASHLN